MLTLSLTLILTLSPGIFEWIEAVVAPLPEDGENAVGEGETGHVGAEAGTQHAEAGAQAPPPPGLPVGAMPE